MNAANVTARATATLEQLAELETLRRFLEHAPATAAYLEALRGWWTPAGWFVCAPCAARIMARGCSLPRGSEPVWRDRPEPYADCATCAPAAPR